MAPNKDLKQLIIDNAQVVFSRFGLKKTTVDEIAFTINKAKSSVYYYFKSKEDIFEAVIEKEASIFRNEIFDAISKAHTPREKIRAYVLTRMRMFQKLANFYTAFQKEYIENYSFINSVRHKYDKEELQIIYDILADGVKKHNLLIKDINITAFAILTALKGFEFPWTIEKNINKIEKDIDILLDILFYGMIKR